MINISDTVFSRIKNKYPSALKTKYPNTFFTTSDRVSDNPKFPTIYVHEMPSVETAMDFEGTSINAVESSFQIEVTDNVSMSNANEVMNYVVSAMKSMRYRVTAMPEFNNNPEAYRKIARFRRTIADNDSL